ncbi:MAG: hypothetical protein AMXMBFR64_50240 [Myxococcales bacterium]
MRHWLMKTEPETFSWDDLVLAGRTAWDGVRNYLARNNMREMSVGDLAFIYYSVKERAIVGIARVVATAHQDPSTDDPRWECVDVAPVRLLSRRVSLDAVKADPALSQMVLVRSSRLSVQPVTEAEWTRVLELAGDA